MALVGEANLNRDRGQTLIGPAHQGFCPFDAPFLDVAVGADADRLFERTAEVIGAETGHPGEIRQGQPIVEMGLDVVTNALQPIARQAIGRRRRDLRWIDQVS